MPVEPLDDPPAVKLVNMLLLNMIKKQLPMARVRVDGGADLWTDGAWVEEMLPPPKFRPLLIDRIKEMAQIPDDAPLSFESKIRLALGKGREVTLDVLYSNSEGGGVAVVTQHEPLPKWLPSNEDVIDKAVILLSHASDALAREDVRARVREATVRVKDQSAYGWFLRRAAWTCIDMGIYDDALAYLATSRELHAGHKTVLFALDAMTGTVYAETNRAKDAQASYESALAIAESLPRPSFYEVYALTLMAQLALNRADVAAAEAALTRAEATVELLLGPKTLARIVPRPVRVRLMRERGDASGAETLALASMSEAEEGGLSEAMELREQLAEIALARGDAPAAVEHVRTILQLPSRSPMRARVYMLLARAQRAIGRDADAIASLRSAVALVDGALATNHPIRIEVEREIATLTATLPYR